MFQVVVPKAFRDFCRAHATRDPTAEYRGLRRGTFITDLATLVAINAQIGHEEWGDYERIIAGKEHPKSGERLWGGLLPFYFEHEKKRRKSKKLARDIYGFSVDPPDGEKVFVWSVHTTVHAYPTLGAWLETLRE